MGAVGEAASKAPAMGLSGGLEGCHLGRPFLRRGRAYTGEGRGPVLGRWSLERTWRGGADGGERRGLESHWGAGSDGEGSLECGARGASRHRLSAPHQEERALSGALEASKALLEEQLEAAQERCARLHETQRENLLLRTRLGEAHAVRPPRPLSGP